MIKELARRLHSPHVTDMAHLKRVMRYVRTTKNHVYNLEVDPQQTLQPTVIADADWGGGPDLRSTSGGILAVVGFPLSVWSKTQPSWAQSSCEAELVSFNYAAAEGKLAVNIMKELGYKNMVLHLYGDSSSAIHAVQRRGPGKMRHIELRELWLQSEIRQGNVQMHKIGTKENSADILTKHLRPGDFQQQAQRLGVDDLEHLEHPFRATFSGNLSTPPAIAPQNWVPNSVPKTASPETAPVAATTQQCFGINVREVGEEWEWLEEIIEEDAELRQQSEETGIPAFVRDTRPTAMRRAAAACGDLTATRSPSLISASTSSTSTSSASSTLWCRLSVEQRPLEPLPPTGKQVQFMQLLMRRQGLDEEQQRQLQKITSRSEAREWIAEARMYRP